MSVNEGRLIIDPDAIAANQAAATIKERRELAAEYRVDGNIPAAQQCDADADKLVEQWQGTRWNVEQLARGI